MDHFHYKNGQLHAEDVSLADIADAVGTPFYCYSTATLNRHFDVFASAFADQDPLIAYAVKANSNIAVVRTLARRGAGAALVSGGELERARAAGIPGNRMVFSGIGKTRTEMALGLDAGLLQFNVESEPELHALSEVAVSKGMVAPMAVRINPDVDAKVHEKISTGLKENKFGIEWTQARELYALADALPGLEIVGISLHIGSQLLDLDPFEKAFLRLRDLIVMLQADGYAIRNVDLGGGLGIPYDGPSSPDPADYARLIRRGFADLNCRVILEPGRMIAGNAGLLVTRMLYRKEGATRTFYVVDAAMNDLTRVALYDAYHGIVSEWQPEPDADPVVADVVGPVCETGDTFAVQRALPDLQGGDLLALRTAGAYGAVMASSYNTRPTIPEVLVSGNRWQLVRRRMEVADLLALEQMPDWLAGDDAAS